MNYAGIPDASVDGRGLMTAAMVPGVITDAAQVFAGLKTLTGGLIVSGVPAAVPGSLTAGVNAALGSFNANVGASALWLAGAAALPATGNYAIAASDSGGLGLAAGLNLNSNGQPISFNVSGATKLTMGSTGALTLTQPGINVASITLPSGAGGYGYGGSINFGAAFNNLGYDGATLYLQGHGVPPEVRGFNTHARVNGFSGAAMGASDVAVKLGTVQADASVNTTAKLSSWVTSMGGTEIEKASIRKDGGAVFGVPASGVYIGPYVYNGQTANGVLNQGGAIGFGNNGSGIYLGFSPGNGLSYSLASFQAGGSLYVGNGAIYSSTSGGPATTLSLISSMGAGSTDIATKIGTSIADASVNATAKIAAFGTGLGGTFTEYLSLIPKAAAFGALMNVSLGSGTHRMLMNVTAVGAGDSSITWNAGSGTFKVGPYQAGIAATHRGLIFSTTGTVDDPTSAQAFLFTSRSTPARPTARTKAVSGQTAAIHVFAVDATDQSSIMANGEFEHLVSGAGLVLRSPDGTRYRLTVANGGTLAIANA